MFYLSGAAMVASIKPYADELALGDGRMLIGGEWVGATDGATWSHTHPATGERGASFPVATAADVDLAGRARRSTRARGRAPGHVSVAGCCGRSPTSCARTARNCWGSRRSTTASR